ncbi:FAD-dependent oxidoreductase [Legionella sp. km772]|uniref:FAD-dependent oxidoreductase n=1 Tax=Legionella sp. km772 TaxID=2498111 RepID=UPI000F8CBDD6|nr:FAD-dependent oxidoreductase [Legionella sp. km772]RUR07521.1 FAD-dependent oxidoreductase [Legionella sp. km772]
MVSLWNAITNITSTYPCLESKLEVDVLIIGGGITGITAAKQLLDSGKTVALIEAHTIGGMTTGSSTGNLYVPVQAFYRSIERHFNLNTAITVAQSRQIAINYIESTVHEFAINCQFKKRPWYAYTNQSDNILFKQEIELWQQMKLGIEEVQSLPLDLKFKQAIMLRDQARFNPLQYVVSLAQVLYKKGCHLFENTRALGIHEAELCTVSTEKATITAQKVIIATHTPIGINTTQFYLAPYRSYVVAVRLKNKEYPEGQFRDMDNSGYILCTHPHTHNEPELLMIAGQHHKTGQGVNMHRHFNALSRCLEQQFDVEETVYQWSAQHYHAADSIPYIGLANSSSKHCYLATGYFADGLVYGTLAGIILGDLLAGKKNELFETYNAQRKDFLNSAPFLFRENGNALVQYLKDLPLFSALNPEDLKVGEGKITEINRIKYAVSKTEDKGLNVIAATCPHMKGIVAWNDAEQTWDCPLHGSRFTPTGEVIEGPATCPLQKHKNVHKDS